LIILTTTGVAFSINAKFCCCTNPLSMKHANSPKSRSVWVHIVVDLPPLIMMGNKKKVLFLKTRKDHFEHMMHQGPVSWSLLRVDIFISFLF
jgi:hypothetical protein